MPGDTIKNEERLIDDTVKEFERILADRFREHDFINVPKVLGRLIQKKCFIGADSLSQNGIGWAIDHAVAEQLGPCIEGYLRIHRYLMDNGHHAGNPWDLGHLDRYAAAYGDTDYFKSFAVMTQNFTYLVVIEVSQELNWEAAKLGQVVYEPAYSLHIRQCCKSQSERDPMLMQLKDLDFLNYREITLKSAYFKHQDARDQGFLCSIRPEEMMQGRWRSSDALTNFLALEYVTKDLSSWVYHASEDND